MVHSRECDKATAVSVLSFEADLVAEKFKMWFQALGFALSCTVVKYIFYRCRKEQELVPGF